MRILIVEDDKIIGDGLAAGLTMDNYAVDWVENIASAETALKTNEYELMILDIGLPDGSGLCLLKSIRESNNNIPVIILTAFDDINFKVQGLDAGSDDYLIKPFKLEELQARLRALRRRVNGNSNPTVTIGDITFDASARKIMKCGNLINLGPKEFMIFQILVEKKGKVVSKAQLEDSLYGWGMEIESNAIEVHIHGLRKKLGKEIIHTVKYVGYRLNDDL